MLQLRISLHNLARPRLRFVVRYGSIFSIGGVMKLLFFLSFISTLTLAIESESRSFNESPIFPTREDCLGIVYNNVGFCTVSDCRALVYNNVSFCRSQDCQAFFYHNPAMCKTNDCRALIWNNAGYCESNNCRGVIYRNVGYCQ